MNLVKVISGGQTGADRAALDAALACGVAIGGWVPKGRKAEDGRISDTYSLIEMPTVDYPARTRKNIEESDATFVLTTAKQSPGTVLTLRLCKEIGKPFWTIAADMKLTKNVVMITKRWIDIGDFKTLNVAGPRESKCPGIYKAAYDFLIQVFGEKK